MPPISDEVWSKTDHIPTWRDSPGQYTYYEKRYGGRWVATGSKEKNNFTFRQLQRRISARHHYLLFLRDHLRLKNSTQGGEPWPMNFSTGYQITRELSTHQKIISF